VLAAVPVLAVPVRAVAVFAAAAAPGEVGGGACAVRAGVGSLGAADIASRSSGGR